MRITNNPLAAGNAWASPHARRMGPTNQSTSTLPVAGRPAADKPAQLGGPVQGLPKQVDLAKFFSAWGSADATYDVTKDGVVDGKDLAIFLS